MGTRTRRLILGAVAAGSLAAVGVPLARSASTPGEPPAAERARVTRRDLAATVKATGVIRPMVGAEVRVGSRASGVLRRLHVRVGDTVRAGQTLAELDARELIARRDQAAAALATAEANRAYARSDLERKRRLASQGLLPESELDLAERAFAVAGTQAAEAAATLELTRTQLAYARIEAPIPGVVASVSTQEGETVAASLSSPTFVTLLDLSRLEVRAYVDETDIGRIRIGQEASFTVDTYPGQEFTGRVATVYPQAEIRDNVVNYVAVVTFTPRRDEVRPRDAQGNPQGMPMHPLDALRPEMTATVRIALEGRKGALTVPRRAVRRDGGAPYVLVPEGKGASRRPVTTGFVDERYSEVLTGLREGEDVLVGEAGDAGAETR